MTASLFRIWRDERGGPAAEFALVAPLLILFLLGIVDVGRLMWEWNQAEKATQMGARFAVVNDPVAASLTTYSYAVSGGIPQGDPVPASSFSKITCNNATCSPCPAYCGSRDATAFNALVTWMQHYKSDITGANVEIDYEYSGLGFAGDPNGPDVSPLVTVRLRNLDFRPIFLLGAVDIAMPNFATTLTMEDADS